MQAELERCLWCCKAASVPSKSRIRILGTLSAILFSRDKTFSADTPPVLQSLLQGLFSLRYCLSLSVYSVLEADSLAGYVSAIRSGSCGELTSVAIETEFGVPFSKSDNEVIIRDILVTESTVRCLTAGDNKCRRWMLLNVLEVCSLGRIFCCRYIESLDIGVLANTGLEHKAHTTSGMRTLAKIADVRILRRNANLSALRGYLS